MRSPDGTIYFYDSGIRLAFTTCDMVAQYGMDCGAFAGKLADDPREHFMPAQIELVRATMIL